MQLQSHSLILDGVSQPTGRRAACFTSLCRLESGIVLCAFQSGPVKNSPTSTLLIFRSGDGGRTWSEIPTRFETTLGGVPGSLAAGELVESEPGRLLLMATWFDRSDPARPLFDPVTEGILKSRQLLSVSSDDGATWSAWREVATPGLTGCATTGPWLRWQDGRIAYPFESFKEFDDPRPGRHAAWLLVSSDGGRTFADPDLVARHPEHRLYYWDQRLCTAGPAGEFVGLFWTHDLADKRDRNVHIGRGSIDDPQRPIASPIETAIPGQIAAPLALDDGRLLAFAVDRGRPGTLRLWQSRDEGMSWPESQSLLIHRHDERALLSQGRDNIDFKQYWEDMGKWSFGHPAICRLDPSHALVAYYAGTPDALSTHAARIALD